MTLPYLLTDNNALRRLAMAIARNHVGPNDPVDEVLAANDVSPSEFDKILEDPVFKGYVKAYAAEFKANGVSFQMKCRVLAEDAIEDLYTLARDLEQPAASRVKAIENLVEWGNLAPKSTAATDGRPGFSITIQLPNTGPMTISSAPHAHDRTLAEDVAAALAAPIPGEATLVDEAYQE